MKIQNRVMAAVVSASLCVGGGAIVGCDDDDAGDTAERKVERAGDKIENAAEKTAEKTENAVEKAGDKIERTADKTGDAVKDATR